MKARINSHVIKARNVASYPLGVLGSIAHPIKEEGEYLGIINLKNQEIARFSLKVDADSKETQVDIDFAEVHKQSFQKSSDGLLKYNLNSKGYLMLYASSGPGGYHISLKKIKGKTVKSVFDSKSLSKGDLFILTLLRPGDYELIEKSSRSVSKITVTYPKVEKKPFSPGKPVTISILDTGFSSKAKAIKVDPGQGIVMQIKSTKSAIVAKLVKPDDGPKKRNRGKRKNESHTWVNPRRI